MADERDVLEGLPPDLAAILRDPSVIVPQDAAVFELIAKFADAPSNTASAMGVGEWRQAWSVTCRRMLKAQAERDRLRGAIQHVIEASPGTPDSVKKYLLRELEGSWGESYEQAMLHDREPLAIKQAREWCEQIGSPLWPNMNESDWATLMRDVLAEYDASRDAEPTS